jgi:hypothetical protein
MMKNKMIVFVLTFFLAICLMGADKNPVYAFSGGSGTFSDPFLVATPGRFRSGTQLPEQLLYSNG